VGAVAARNLEATVIIDVQRAQADLERGRQQLEDGYRRQDPGLASQAFSSFSSSRERLRRVARRVQVADVARAPLSPSPIRDRVQTLDAVIAAGTHLDRAGMTAAQALLSSGVIGGPQAATGPTQSPGDLTALVASIRDELEAARNAAVGIDLSVLPSGSRPALGRALSELGSTVTALDTLWPSLGAVLDLLGLDGPRTYLIEQVNPAELRAGGGFIGTVSLVHADRGRVTLAKSLPVEAFDYCDAAGCTHPRPLPWQAGYVAPPAELTGYPLPSYSRLTAWSLEDSGFYPDFATSAALAERFTKQLLGVDVDGVVAVDYYAVAPLLDLSGPVQLPQYHLTLTSANFVDTVVGEDLARDPAHKDVISAAAAQMITALGHLKAADLPRLVNIVQEQVRGRHFQAHFNRPAVQSQAGRLGATDVVDPGGSPDFLLETEDNYGGSKSNYFMERSYHLALSIQGPRLHHQLTIDLHDGAPYDRPWIGPHYFAYLRITVPAAAVELTMASTRSTEYALIQPPARRTQVPPPGAQVAGGWIFVMVGPGLSGRFEATFTWDTAWVPGLNGAAQVYWQKQPGTVRDPVEVTWNPGTGAYSATGDLGVDRVLQLRPDGVALS
jgi:hypothetical protein